MHDYRELAKRAARAASDKKAVNIVVFDLRQNSDLTDYVVIAGAESSPQLNALQFHIEDVLREAGAKPLHRDGQRRGRWMALDYGSLVVHVMMPEARDLYRLEHLWDNPKRVTWEDKDHMAEKAPEKEIFVPKVVVKKAKPKKKPKVKSKFKPKFAPRKPKYDFKKKKKKKR